LFLGKQQKVIMKNTRDAADAAALKPGFDALLPDEPVRFSQFQSGCLSGAEQAGGLARLRLVFEHARYACPAAWSPLEIRAGSNGTC
jgi:hypothetical protein